MLAAWTAAICCVTSDDCGERAGSLCAVSAGHATAGGATGTSGVPLPDPSSLASKPLARRECATAGTEFPPPTARVGDTAVDSAFDLAFALLPVLNAIAGGDGIPMELPHLIVGEVPSVRQSGSLMLLLNATAWTSTPVGLHSIGLIVPSPKPAKPLPPCMLSIPTTRSPDAPVGVDAGATAP